MASLQSYTQKQLASSVVGVPGVDRSGEIAAAGLQKVAGAFADFQIQNLQRRTAAEDSLAINAIGESRDTANLEMQQFMQANPDPATWENGWNTVIQKQQKGFIGKTLTRGAAANERVNQKAFELEGRMKVQIAATEQTVTNSIDATGENLVKILGDPFSTDIQKEKQTKAYKDALLQRHTIEIADIMVDEVQLAGKEQEIENANKIARNFAAIDPSSAIDIAKKELEARGQGKTLFSQFASMSNSDIEALKDYAGTVGNERDGKSKKLADAKKIDEYGKIRNAAPGQPFDLDASSDSIELDPDINDEDKIELIEKIKSYYSTYNTAISEKVVTTDEARIAMNKMRQKIKRGDTIETGGFYIADNAFADYKIIKSDVKTFGKINTVDNKAFLNNIFNDEESARDIRVAKIATVLDRKENQIRDFIENQPNLISTGQERIVNEIVRDFANKAVIEFTDKFIDDTPETFDRDVVDAEATRLIQRFTLSQSQQLRAIFAREFAQAANANVQQELLKKEATRLQQEGKIEEAEAVVEEAKLLGIPVDGKKVSTTEKPKKSNKLGNIFDLFIKTATSQRR